MWVYSMRDYYLRSCYTMMRFFSRNFPSLRQLHSWTSTTRRSLCLILVKIWIPYAMKFLTCSFKQWIDFYNHQLQLAAMLHNIVKPYKQETNKNKLGYGSKIRNWNASRREPEVVADWLQLPFWFASLRNASPGIASSTKTSRTLRPGWKDGCLTGLPEA